jgi:DnaJ-class molecular chaperone
MEDQDNTPTTYKCGFCNGTGQRDGKTCEVCGGTGQAPVTSVPPDTPGY